MPYRLGVDLGTTFTAAAVSSGASPTMVGLGNRALQIPSVLFLRDDGTFAVGEAAQRRALAEPGRVVREFKRRIGDSVPLLVLGQPYSPQALTARVLRHVVAVVTEQLGEPPAELVLTHPATWGPYKLDLLEQVAALADAGPATLCPEPVAAAAQYAARTRVEEGSTLAVYDLGGGTFDACVLRKTGTGFTVLGDPEGLAHLGGMDFDEALFQHALSLLGDRVRELDPEDPGVTLGLAALQHDCVEAKEALSSDTEAVLPVALPGLATTVRLTRHDVETLIRPALAETVSALQRALRSAGVGAEQLAAIVLVGGSSRIPLVRELLQQTFRTTIALDTHPKHDIALGALRAVGGGAPTPVPARPPARAARAAGASVPVPPAAAPRRALVTPAAAAGTAAAGATTAGATVSGPPPPTPPAAPVPGAAAGGPDPGWRRRPVLLAAAAAVVAALVVVAVLVPEGPQAGVPAGSSTAPTSASPASPTPTGPAAPTAPRWERSGEGLTLEWDPPAGAAVDDYAWQRVFGNVDAEARGSTERPRLRFAELGDTTRMCLDVVSREGGEVSPPLHTCWPVELAPRSAQPLADDALVRRHQQDGRWTISTLTTAGAPLEELVTGSGARAPVLSRDRHSVYYLERKGDRTALRAVAVDGSGDRRLFADHTEDCPRMRRPAARSDGALVLVCGSADPDGEDRLVVMTLEGGFIRELDAGVLGDPTLSPDRQTVVYTREDSGEVDDGGQLYRRSLDEDGVPEPLGDDRALNPVYSPTEDVIAYERVDDDLRSVVTLAVPEQEDVGQPATLSPPGVQDRDPSWSPDGTRLAVRRLLPEEAELVLLPADGTGQGEVVAGTRGRLTAPSWSSR